MIPIQHEPFDAMHSISKCFLFTLLSLPVYAYDKFDRFDEPDNGFQEFIEGNSELLIVDEKIIDVPYEKGKSIFYGRGNSPKLPYCVRNDTKIVKVKRSSMKIYKHALASELADELYHCDNPDRKIINELSRNDFIYVMYYLNTEYKLYLKRD